MEPTQKTSRSKDDSSIAYVQSGSGPVIVLVSAALADHTGTKKLAKLLTENFTVISYDRRGRGESTDAQPYSPMREVEDIEALIDASGGKAFLLGNSSGAVLALEAASKLGKKIEGLFMYEPPFIVDDSQPPVPDDLASQISRLIIANSPNAAVKLFFTKGMSIPAPMVTMMRLFMPGWSKMAKIAHTIPYDLAILADTQSGKSLPAERWASLKAPVVVAVGSRSQTFFHNGAKALAALLPHTTYFSLPGGNHGSIMISPKGIATTATQFFLSKNKRAQ
jgi:pimeloyl-ACP methyl ester carboxylesterase